MANSYDAMQVAPLREACQTQLTDHMTTDTVFPCYSYADSVSDNKLRSACIGFMARPSKRCVLYLTKTLLKQEHCTLARSLDNV